MDAASFINTSGLYPIAQQKLPTRRRDKYYYINAKVNSKPSNPAASVSTGRPKEILAIKAYEDDKHEQSPH